MFQSFLHKTQHSVNYVINDERAHDWQATSLGCQVTSLHYDPVLALFDLPKTGDVVIFYFGHAIGNDAGEEETAGAFGSFNDRIIANSRKIWTV